MHVAETGSGIEVSFSDELLHSPTARDSVLSLREQLLRSRKVHRAQFRVETAAPESSTLTEIPFEPGKHRVPLFGIRAPQSFDDVLFLLRSHEVRDEFSCVREELAHTNSELTALEADRVKLEQKTMKIGNGESDLSWEINRCLAGGKHTPMERSVLQEQRGLALTVSMHNQQSREAFLARCGSTASLIRKTKSEDDALATVRPETCREGGAAATIQHVTLLPSGFFISRDKGKSSYWGRLPDRLFRRMKSARTDTQASDFLYLSTGPMGCYYAEFRSGECWWGSVAEDTDFDAICKDKDWDIYRVAFGPCTSVTDATGHKHFSTSWIILGRDGRAAWKNLPARLHNLLERRLASDAAPAEVALGGGGAYFIAFLDGSTDYMLPTAAAKACREIEASGLNITAMSLHPELSNDFIIRHQ